MKKTKLFLEVKSHLWPRKMLKYLTREDTPIRLYSQQLNLLMNSALLAPKQNDSTESRFICSCHPSTTDSTFWPHSSFQPQFPPPPPSNTPTSSDACQVSCFRAIFHAVPAPNATSVHLHLESQVLRTLLIHGRWFN